MRRVPDPIRPGTSPPLLIAHRAGNSAAEAERAFDAGADYLETDLWVHNGHFEARHERRLPFGIPGLYEKWHLSRLSRERDPFGALLRASGKRAGIFLDLKNGGEQPSVVMARSLQEADVALPIAVSSQHWSSLRAVARAAPAIAVYYSVDSTAKLDLLLSVARRDPYPAGTSCRHTLLDLETVERLHGAGLAVVAWTVDDARRATELAEIGVDAITTHHVAELRSALGAAVL